MIVLLGKGTLMPPHTESAPPRRWACGIYQKAIYRFPYLTFSLSAHAGSKAFVAEENTHLLTLPNIFPLLPLFIPYLAAFCGRGLHCTCAPGDIAAIIAGGAIPLQPIKRAF